jgi:hypothetical protein
MREIGGDLELTLEPELLLALHDAYGVYEASRGHISLR